MALCPHPRHWGMATVPLSVFGSSYISQFLLLTFHLPVLGRMGEGGPLRGSTGPRTDAHPKSGCPLPIHSTSKGLPSAHLLRSLPMLCSPLSPLPPLGGPHLPWAKVSRGQGPSRGPRRWGRGKGKETLSYLTLVPAGEGSRGGGKGAWRVLFYLLFPDFFVSKLADLYYTKDSQ